MLINDVITHLEATLGDSHEYTITLKEYVNQMEELAPVKNINKLALEFIDWRLETIEQNLIAGHGQAWAKTLDKDVVRDALIDSLDTKESFMHLAAQITRQNKGILLTTKQVEILQREVWRKCNNDGSCVTDKIQTVLNNISNG